MPKAPAKEAPQPAESPASAAQPTAATEPAQTTPHSPQPNSQPSNSQNHERTDQLAAYQAALIAAIAEKKFYPPLAQRLGQEGMITVALTVEADGRFSDIHLVGSPDSAILGRGAMEAVEALGHFRPLPAALGLQRMPVQVTLVYKLR